MNVANGRVRLVRVAEPVDLEVYEVLVCTYEGKVLPRREGRDMDTTRFWISAYDTGTSHQGKEGRSVNVCQYRNSNCNINSDGHRLVDRMKNYHETTQK